jgi:hypothetical protein
MSSSMVSRSAIPEIPGTIPPSPVQILLFHPIPATCLKLQQMVSPANLSDYASDSPIAVADPQFPSIFP